MLEPLARKARYPGFGPFSSASRLTVRMLSAASPESRLPRLAPPSRSSPLPERRCSMAAQSAGSEQATVRRSPFSTQRNAGTSSLLPSRIPAWLAPVCEERSVSHSVSA